MFRSILIIFAVFFCFFLQGQSFPQDQWYVGHVTLNDGQRKEGYIKYDLDANSVQYQWENKVESYYANQFYTFAILVEEENQYRVFYVLPYEGDNNYKRPTIFELIREGNTSLLAREYIATRNDSPSSNFYRGGFGRGVSPYNPPYDPSFTTRYLAFKLFLADEKGRIKPLSSRKKEVIATFGEHQKELKKFIKKERIKTDQVMDMAKLVNYFNELNGQ